jgi:hypothetical protein
MGKGNYFSGVNLPERGVDHSFYLMPRYRMCGALAPFFESIHGLEVNYVDNLVLIVKDNLQVRTYNI